MKTKLAENFSRIDMVLFVLQNSGPKFYLKMGHFGFSYLIKNYAKNTQSVTDIIISK